MITKINFNKNGYDSFIDFIKAYAIICVLLGHTFYRPMLGAIGYSYMCGMQVPLFILIQVFHGYKNFKRVNFKKIFLRVLFPFIIIESLIIIISLLTKKINNLNDIYKIISIGGVGPGSYYPWVYLQVAIIMSILAPFFPKCNKILLLVLFLIVCESFEILFSLINLPNYVYRLLAVRYFFLIYLGYKWVNDGIKLSAEMIVLSIISLFSIIYFSYFSTNTEPFFYKTTWKYHRWPCYYYVSNLLVYLLYLLYCKIKQIPLFINLVRIIASSSYEIFLVQMMLIYLFKYDDILIIKSTYLKYMIWFIIVWIISLMSGIVINKYIFSKIYKICMAR